MTARAAIRLLVVALLFVALAGCSKGGREDPEEAGAGEITTVAGGGKRTVTIEGVDVADADLTAIAGVAVGPDGAVYVVIHDAPALATRSTVARIEGDRIRALEVGGDLSDVKDIDVAADGSIVLVDATRKQVLRLRDGDLQVVTTELGGKPLEEPVGVDVADDGTIYVADASGGRIGAVAADGTTSIVKEGSFSVSRPGDVLATPEGVVYFEWTSALVWRIAAGTGALEGIAGDGDKGAGGDGAAASSAQLVAGRLAAGPDGELFLAQGASNKVRAVGRDGIIRTVAGTGEEGYSGDGRDAREAELREPIAVAYDGRGGLLVADFGNGRLRRVVLG